MLARRALLRRLGGASDVRRPPWTASDFIDGCTRCNACVDACPEQVLRVGDGGYPQLDFSHAGCSLCGDCVRACEADVFDLGREALPWRARIDERCLAQAGIHCRSCDDACEPRAIRFHPQLGGPSLPILDSALCTGCGACLAPCPGNAIHLNREAIHA